MSDTTITDEGFSNVIVMDFFNTFPDPVIEGFAGRIVGFTEADYSAKDKFYMIILAAKGSNSNIYLDDKRGVNPVMFKCWGSKEKVDGGGIALPGKVRWITSLGHTLENPPELPMYIYAPTYSTAFLRAQREKQIATAAKLVCRKCSEMIAFLEAGKYQNGWMAISGETYHGSECVKCTPGSKSCRIEEMDAFGKTQEAT